MDFKELRSLKDSIGMKDSEVSTLLKKRPLSKCSAQYSLNAEIPIFDGKRSEENIEYVSSLLASFFSKSKEER